MKNVAFIDRTFDGNLIKGSTNKVWDDYETTLELLNLDVTVKRDEIVFSSEISSAIPEKWLSKLECIGTVDMVVDEIFSHPLRSTSESIIDSLEPTNSLSNSMAKLERSVRVGDPDGHLPVHYLEHIIENYGPSPYYLDLLFQSWLKNGKASSVISYMEKHPKSTGLFRPVQLNSYIDNYKKSVSQSDYETLMSLCG